jgi:hypothetical protein
VSDPVKELVRLLGSGERDGPALRAQCAAVHATPTHGGLVAVAGRDLASVVLSALDDDPDGPWFEVSWAVLDWARVHLAAVDEWNLQMERELDRTE